MKRILAAGFLLVSIQAVAAEVPRSLPSGMSDFTHKSLGNACFAMESTMDGLPCNPAFTAKERKTVFQGQLFFGNNISYAKEVNSLMKDEGNQETLERLFNQKRSSEAEANVELGFHSEKFGMSFSPYRAAYFSLIRNQSLPVITLYATEDQVLSAQFASYIGQDFFFGLRIRGVQRRFIFSEFTLTDALAEGGADEILRIQNQRALYLEPGLIWEPEDREWNPRFSLAMTEFGAVDKKYEHLPASPQVHLGGAVRPELRYGGLELGANFTFRSQYDRWTELLRLGTVYTLGSTQYVASFTEDNYALSFLVKFETFRGGLTYDYKQFENLVGEADQVRTLYLQIGAEI